MTIVYQKISTQQGKTKQTDRTQATNLNTTMMKRSKITARTSNYKLRKYWAQRYRLFSRFDDGIKLDDESWWSVTPEKIARHIAARFHDSLGGHLTILDGFCGVGGNLIQFALYSPHIRVIGCDNNLKRLKMAKHNAKIYGVEHQCEFILGDFMSIIRSLQCRNVDAIFLSPPWGGIGYTEIDKYSLNQMTPDGYEVVDLCRKYITNNIAFLMPRNTNIDEVRKVLLTPKYPELECEQNMVGSKIKTITMYFGDLVDHSIECEPSPKISSAATTISATTTTTTTTATTTSVSDEEEDDSRSRMEEEEEEENADDDESV